MPKRPMKDEFTFVKAWRSWQVMMVAVALLYFLTRGLGAETDWGRSALDAVIGYAGLQVLTLPLTVMRLRWGAEPKITKRRERLSKHAMFGLVPALAMAPPAPSWVLFALLEGHRDRGWYVYTFLILIPFSLAIALGVVILLGFWPWAVAAFVGSVAVLIEGGRQKLGATPKAA